jgi:hypothetical protein
MGGQTLQLSGKEQQQFREVRCAQVVRRYRTLRRFGNRKLAGHGRWLTMAARALARRSPLSLLTEQAGQGNETGILHENSAFSCFRQLLL